jgi:hypothetical protein
MLDSGYDFKTNDPNWFDVVRPTKLPSFNGEFAPNGKVYCGVRQTRFGVMTSTPTRFGDLKTQFEFELFGTGVDAGQTTFRLRHAYGELGQFGAGQTWSPFMDIDVFPNQLEYWGPSGMVFFRNVQLRWMPVRSDRTRVILALERPGASADQGIYADRIDLQGVRSKFNAPDVSRQVRIMRGWGYLIGGLLAGCSQPKPKETASQPAAAAPAPPALSSDLAVVQQSKGPILTTLEEFYKIGPGPSSSHTMGPMRITYDFFQRVSKLPADQLQRATAVKVHLFGSLSATGKGHGTDRASLAGPLGKAPASCPPEFLDGLAAHPDQAYKVTIGPKSLDLSLKDIIFDAPKGDFHHPNTLTAKLLAGDETLYELEYYSVGGGFIEWKGYKTPDKGQPKYPFQHAQDLKKYLIDDKIPLSKLLLENEMAISGKNEKEITEFLDQVAEVMVRGVDTGLKTESVLPGPIKLHSKAAAMRRNLKTSAKGEAGRAVTRIASYGPVCRR